MARKIQEDRDSATDGRDTLLYMFKNAITYCIFYIVEFIFLAKIRVENLLVVLLSELGLGLDI